MVQLNDAVSQLQLHLEQLAGAVQELSGLEMHQLDANTVSGILSELQITDGVSTDIA